MQQLQNKALFPGKDMGLDLKCKVTWDYQNTPIGKIKPNSKNAPGPEI